MYKLTSEETEASTDKYNRITVTVGLMASCKYNQHARLHGTPVGSSNVPSQNA